MIVLFLPVFLYPESPAVEDVVSMIYSSNTMQNKELEDTKLFIRSFVPYLNPKVKVRMVYIRSTFKTL